MTKGAILVTGAGGFVCSEVAIALQDNGHDVVAIDQKFDGPTRTRLAGIRQMEGPLGAVLNGGDVGPVSAVIHGAAVTASPERLGISRAAHIRRNTDLLTATLDFAAGVGATRFLFISSMGVFEPHDSPVTNGRFDEQTIATADCAYCAAKQAGEVLTSAAADAEFATLSLRLGNIFGPHEAVRETRQHLCLVSRMIDEARRSGVITVQTPDALREWSWLPDLAREIAALAVDLPQAGPTVLHAGSPPVLSDLDLAKAVASRCGGTTLRLAAPPHGAIRPPMGSAMPSPFVTAHWTPIADALDLMTDLVVS